ncbi:MAG: CZB domain-containing protein, partial [Desulfuromonadales bacterium]|nr:CZB domain-containing protein [Desulfuromonadales bacterium]
MRWKDLRLGLKFTAGFGSLLLLMSAIGAWSFFGVNNIVDDAGQVIAGNQLRGMIAQREVDHLNWLKKLSDFLNDEHVTKLDIETDEHKCGFGQWYYGEGRTRAQQLIPELRGTLERIEEPHRQLHASAIKIEKLNRAIDPTISTFLAQKEVDHLIWVNKIYDYLLLKKSRIGIQTDDHLCGLGKFIYGEKGKELSNTDAQLASLLEQIKEPHRQLHDSAIAIEQAGTNYERAQQLFRDRTLPALDNTRQVIEQLQQRADELIAGVTAARQVYASETTPSLVEIQKLLKEVVATTTANIMSDEEMLAEASTTRVGVLIILLVALPLGILLALIIARGIQGPVQQLVVMIREMERGRLGTRLNLNRSDEIGQMGATMDAFADSLENEVIHPLQRLADGDLTFSVTPRDERDSLRGALQKLGQDLNGILGQVHVAAEQIASGSAQVSDSSQSLSQGA